MSKSINIYIEQGSDFLAVFPPVTNPNGTVMNLTGYTVIAQLRRGYTSHNAVQFVSTITNAPGGVITLTMVNTHTGGLTPLRHVYDVIVISSAQVRTKVFEGLCIVNPGVTDKPNTTLLTPNIPDDYGGI